MIDTYFNTKNIRNIGIIAHIDAGKTTTSERILFYTGKVYKIGEVHDGSAVMDWMEQERARGITITSACTVCHWKDCKINLIDTPGHIDFNIEVERTLRILDGAVAVFDGVSGVEPQSICVWKQSDRYKVPRICFINKMDRTGASYEKSILSIKNTLSDNTLVLYIPYFIEDEFVGVINIINGDTYKWDKNHNFTILKTPLEYIEYVNYYKNILIDTLANRSNDFMQLYLNNDINENTIIQYVRTLTLSCDVYPILCGSSLKNIGVQLLLDCIVSYLPSPLDKDAQILKNDLNEEYIVPVNKLCALAFKNMNDTFIGDITFCRIYSGSLSNGSKIFNVNRKKWYKVQKLVEFHADRKTLINKAEVGNVVGVAIGDTYTGDTILDEEKYYYLSKINIPLSVVKVSIIPNTKEDQNKMTSVLSRMVKEDPTLSVYFDSEINQWILCGVGELHLEVTVSRMKSEHNVNLTIGKPKISLRETITTKSTVEYQHKKQSGGAGQFAVVNMSIEPCDKDFIFINNVTGGNIPKNYISVIKDSVIEELNNGHISKSKVINVKVILIDGKFHEVDSNSISFELAAKYAIRELLSISKPIVLEPILSLFVVTPYEYFSNVIKDLSSKDAQIISIQEDINTNMKTISSKIPASNIIGYSASVRSITKGMATFNYEFCEYRQCSTERYNLLLSKNLI